jgi:hypothetical protein
MDRTDGGTHARARARALLAGAALVAATAAAQAAPGDWPQFGRTAAHPGNSPAETAFTPGNVASLQVLWKGDIGPNTAAEGGTVIVGSRLYTTGTDGRLSVFDLAGCGAEVCQPLWQGTTGNDITGTAAVVGDRVYVASADHLLHVFDANGCGAPLCKSLWTGQLADGAVDSSAVVAGGKVYVGDFSGQLSVFSADGCGQKLCQPLWTAQAGLHRQINSAPAVGAGSVFVQVTYSTPFDSTGGMLVFDADGCGVPVCQPTWSADLGGPPGSTGSPLVTHGKVIVGSGHRFGGPNGRDHLFAFDASGCGAPVCEPIQIFKVSPEGIGTTPAISGDMLYVSSDVSPNPGTVGVVSVFDLAHCGTECEASWTGIDFVSGFESPPAVAGDVVFVGKGPAGDIGNVGVFAFDARGCEGRRLCQALTLVVLATDGFYLSAPLAIAHDRIAFIANDNAAGTTYVAVMGLP